jgi:hypothetical protein
LENGSEKGQSTLWGALPYFDPVQHFKSGRLAELETAA